MPPAPSGADDLVSPRRVPVLSPIVVFCLLPSACCLLRFCLPAAPVSRRLRVPGGRCRRFAAPAISYPTRSAPRRRWSAARNNVRRATRGQPTVRRARHSPREPTGCSARKVVPTNTSAAESTSPIRTKNESIACLARELLLVGARQEQHVPHGVVQRVVGRVLGDLGRQRGIEHGHEDQDVVGAERDAPAGSSPPRLRPILDDARDDEELEQQPGMFASVKYLA